MRKTGNLGRVLVLGAFALLRHSATLCAQEYLPNLPVAHPAIRYAERAVDDPIARLSRDLENGSVELDGGEEALGYLSALLEYLDIRTDSQALVFSKTSFQATKIAPDNPRAIYFNDDVQQKPSLIEDNALINRYHVEMMTYFLDKLKNTPDGDGNLLDHTLVLYGSPMGNGNIHGHKQVPMLLLGHAAGTLEGNLHLRCPDETPQANILLTSLQKLGMNVESIGDSTEPLSI